MQYRSPLTSAGVDVTVSPLLGNDYLKTLGSGRRPVSAVVAGYTRRLLNLIGAGRYDVLWIHCELFPYFPAFFERLARLWGKPVVFDYDDAIFHMYDRSSRPLVRRLLADKLRPLLKSASACCCGNAYLRDYAAQFCPHSLILPTVVDTDVYRPRQDRRPPHLPTIGWIGSPSTWEYVRPLLPLLRQIAERGEARVKIVGAGTPAEGDVIDGFDWVEWSEATEVEDVQSMDIGIMPLSDDPWTRGKSGYKLVQYMACGLPVVASPVGVNCEMVSEGENGFLASTIGEWQTALKKLVADAGLRQRLGEAGRQRAVSEYSLQAQAPRLIQVFESCAQ